MADAQPPIDEPTPASAKDAPTPPITRGWLIGFGIAIVVLSFVAAFLGGWLARSASTEAAPTPEPTPTAESVDYEEALADILPAGSAVRAGTGAPEAGKGDEGDVYIDISSADVWLFQDDWVLVGNIRTSAAENLTGEQGPQGEPGAAGEQGEQGEQGEAGAAGTQVTLGLGAPEAERCTTDGDLYIDTETVEFYECAAGEWTLFGPAGGPAPSESPTPEPTEGDEG
ncbi:MULTISPECIES: hypothetical protein [unclassified Agromyces]|uniref:hypothetical protein n=1 Tax=unclassified Agromyces TaxID=2639701 RepID=UPI003014E265